MQDIVNRVHRVDGLMSEIAEVSSGQRAGVERVTRAIAEIERMTHENTDAVKQFAAAVRGTLERTDRLEDGVRAFEQAPDNYGRRPRLSLNTIECASGFMASGS